MFQLQWTEKMSIQSGNEGKSKVRTTKLDGDIQERSFLQGARGSVVG
jgi:hypothetical protein